MMMERLDRREFLKSGLVTTAAALTAGAVGNILSPVKSFASEMPDLVVSHRAGPRGHHPRCGGCAWRNQPFCEIREQGCYQTEHELCQWGPKSLQYPPGNCK